MKLQALRISQPPAASGAEVVASLQTLQLEDLTAGEVLIRVAYSSINYKDALAATGTGKILRRYPLNGGVDLAGTVVSSESPAFTAGQSVLVTGCGLSETLDGGYAEYARVPAAAVIALPPNLSLLDAMTLGTAGFTAALAIDRLEHNGLQPSNLPVLVTGATGGVGSLAIDLLSARGYEVHALTGKRTEHDYLRDLGAAQVLVREEVAVAMNTDTAPLRAVTYAGGIETLGGEWLSGLLRSTAPQGSVASIGLAASPALSMTVMPFILRGVNLLGITSANTPRPLRERVWQRLASDMSPRHLARIRTRIVSLQELPHLFNDYLHGHVRGRTVVKIQD